MKTAGECVVVVRDEDFSSLRSYIQHGKILVIKWRLYCQNFNPSQGPWAVSLDWIRRKKHISSVAHIWSLDDFSSYFLINSKSYRSCVFVTCSNSLGSLKALSILARVIFFCISSCVFSRINFCFREGIKSGMNSSQMECSFQQIFYVIFDLSLVLLVIGVNLIGVCREACRLFVARSLRGFYTVWQFQWSPPGRKRVDFLLQYSYI